MRSQLLIHSQLNSSKLLKEHWRSNAEYKDFLKSHKIFPTVNEFQSNPTTTIGFIAEAHPHLTHLLSFKQSLYNSLENTSLDTEELTEHTKSTDFSLPTESVPRFALFFLTRTISLGSRQAKMEVLAIRCARSDQRLLTCLLCKASSENRLLLGFFVPSKANSPSDYNNILKGHASYISNLRFIPILGLSRQAAHTITCDNNGTPFLFVQAMSTLLKSQTIQPTTRTNDLGKWLVV